jgi:hypothetical protein
MSQADSLRLFTAEARVRFQFNSFEICGGQSGNEKGFSVIASAFPGLYYSTNAQYPATRCSYQKDKRMNPGNLSKGNASFTTRRH